MHFKSWNHVSAALIILARWACKSVLCISLYICLVYILWVRLPGWRSLALCFWALVPRPHVHDSAQARDCRLGIFYSTVVFSIDFA